jgi:hypothetical protein
LLLPQAAFATTATAAAVAIPAAAAGTGGTFPLKATPPPSSAACISEVLGQQMPKARLKQPPMLCFSHRRVGRRLLVAASCVL